MAELKTPKVRILIEQPNSDDGLEYVVQTDNRDLVQWDLIRGRKGWPSAADAANLWMTVIAWHALTRTGEIKTELDAFIKSCIDISKVESVTVDPTQPDHVAGS